MKVRLAVTAVLGLIGLLFAVTGCAPASSPTPAPSAAGYRGARLDRPYVMPDVTLTDTAGKPFNLRTSPTKPVRLVFFAYTKCPDICVGVLADQMAAINRLTEPERAKIEFIWITVDPARDTREVIRTYLDRFGTGLVGLTGDLPRIKALAEKVGVSIESTVPKPGGYEVNHTAQVIGFDSKSNGLIVWTPGTPIGDLRHDLELLIKEVG